MNVLILLSDESRDGVLVKLHTDELVGEVKRQIINHNNSKAMLLAVTKGVIEKRVDSYNIHTIRTDLILSRSRSSWDLKK